MVQQINRQVQDKGLTITVTNDARLWLAEKGFDPVYGARPLRRLIQRSIEDMLAEELLSGKLSENQDIQITVKDDESLGYALEEPEEHLALPEVLV